LYKIYQIGYTAPSQVGIVSCFTYSFRNKVYEIAASGSRYCLHADIGFIPSL